MTSFFDAAKISYYEPSKLTLPLRLITSAGIYRMQTNVPQIYESTYKNHIEKFVSSMKEKSPYWGRTLEDKKIETIEDFVTHVPYTTRAMVENYSEELKNTFIKNPFFFTTSGTTGKSLKIYHHKGESIFTRMLEYFSIQGIKKNDKICVIAPEGSSLSAGAPPWTLVYPYLLAGSHTGLSNHLDKLNEPKLVLSYSRLPLFYMNDANLLQAHPKLFSKLTNVGLTGEKLTGSILNDYKRFNPNLKVDNILASTEFNFIATECKNRKFHVLNGMFPEIKPVDDEQRKELEYIGIHLKDNSGELVLTDLLNKNAAMFLPRYRTGDLVTMHESCDCGKGQCFEYIGRVSDISKHFDKGVLLDAISDICNSKECKSFYELIGINIKDEGNALVFTPIIYTKPQYEKEISKTITKQSIDEMLISEAYNNLYVKSGEWKFTSPNIVREYPDWYKTKVKVFYEESR